ncbi:DUF1592 domain-containing protein [Marinagarivorans algicola]|uniref:DUF1592 domain-containing protein n=1 Tax=Marinagarivorans algicola TaxID=1513270 RepID=UPI0006B4E0AF|nr:DUF1592 domain-containing protein [Marinagarivorans algicola]
MRPIFSPSMAKLAGLIVSATSLAACVSDTDPTDPPIASSSVAPVSSPAPVSSSSTPVPVSSAPVSSTPAPVSSAVASSVSAATTVRVQAQDYDRFNEADAMREGATAGRCSQGDFDLVNTTDNNGTCAAGYTAAGEWLEFDVTGLVAGTYNLVARTSSGLDGKRIDFTVGGNAVGTVTSPNNGWDMYANVSINNISINGTNAVIRASFPDGAINLNYFELKPTGAPASSTPAVSSSSAPTSSAPASSTPAPSSSSVAMSSSQAPVPSSSSVAASSTPAVVTPADADLAAGEASYAQHTCQICHAYKENGVFAALGGADFNINSVIAAKGFDGLVTSIADTMPKGGANKCIDDCALDTAAWMLEIAKTVTTPLSCNANELSYGLRTARLLNVLELKNSLVDLNLISESDFKDSYEYTSGAAGKSRYSVNTSVGIEETRLDKLMAAAENLSIIAAQKTKQQASCGDNCKQAFLNKAEKLYRRPLTNEEKAEFNTIFTEYTGDAALEVAFYAAISSPSFVYKSEVGIPVAQAKAQNMNIGQFADGSSKLNAVDNNAYVLTNYELATALSYMYTGSTPDDALLNAARDNKLNTEAQILTQIDRLMQTKRGKEHTGNFGATWFLADTVLGATRLDPKLTPNIKADMAREVRETFKRVIYDDSVPFGDLYGGDETVLNRRLAQYYGVSTPSNGNNDWAVTTTTERGGVLTSGAFMVSTASDAFTRPIIRAVEVRELMLCHVVPPPNNITLPADQQEALKEQREQALAAIQSDFQAGTLTSREYFERQTDYPACKSCHERIINPLFGLEDFDAYGLPRTVQNGVKANGVGVANLPVDNTGTLFGFVEPGTESESFAFTGTKDLGKQMADLPAVKECLATNTFRWLTHLPIEKKAYSKQANGAIDEQVLLSEEQEDAYACIKQDLVAELDSTNNPKNVYRKVGTLDLIRLRRSIDASQLQN